MGKFTRQPLALAGHPLGVIWTQIASVTRLTKGHPDCLCPWPPGWLTPRKQDQRLVPRCRRAEVGTGLHLIRQRLHGGARGVGTQRQFLEEVFGGFIRWRQSIAIDGNALPLCHCSLFLWHDGVAGVAGGSGKGRLIFLYSCQHIDCLRERLLVECDVAPDAAARAGTRQPYSSSEMHSRGSTRRR